MRQKMASNHREDKTSHLNALLVALEAKMKQEHVILAFDSCYM